MDSPGAYPESPTDQDDVVYPCKGCGEVLIYPTLQDMQALTDTQILEEGKAFELGKHFSARHHVPRACPTPGTVVFE